MKRSTILLTVSFLFLAQRGFGLDSGWTVQASTTLSNLYGVSFVDANTWVAVGNGGTIMRSTDGGIGWSSVPSPVGDPLRAVSFHGNIGVAAGIAGRVVRTTDGGLSWIQEPRPTTRALYAVSLGTSYGVMTGEEGFIFVSTDEGVTWTTHTAGTASVLFGVSVSGATAVGVGGRAAVVMSVNSGQGWGLTVLGDPQTLFFYGTSFVNTTTGWAVGSYTPTGSIIVKSIQSGFVWTLQSAPTTNILFGVSFTSVDSGTAVGFNGTIVHTTNGGTDWTLQQSNTLQTLSAVSFFDSRTGIAVGDSGTILRTTTGGITSVRQQALPDVPATMQLEQNFPNPFNPATEIRFSVGSTDHASLTVSNLLGQQVATLFDGQAEAGQSYSVHFDASQLASGIYFYRLQTKTAVATRKFSLVR